MKLLTREQELAQIEKKSAKQAAEWEALHQKLQVSPSHTQRSTGSSTRGKLKTPNHFPHIKTRPKTPPPPMYLKESTITLVPKYGSGRVIPSHDAIIDQTNRPTHTRTT